MKAYISVTIGRNIGEKPMKWSNWQQFIDSTRIAIQTRLQVEGWLFDGDGVGTWGNDTEESYAIIVLARHDYSDIYHLRQRLALLSKVYNQEAIGCAIVPLVSGDETLIYPNEYKRSN